MIRLFKETGRRDIADNVEEITYAPRWWVFWRRKPFVLVGTKRPVRYASYTGIATIQPIDPHPWVDPTLR